MKKILLIFIVMFCGASVAQAAGIGNSIQPIGKRKFSLSVEDNVIFDKEMKSRNKSTAPAGNIAGTKFKFKTVNQTYGKVVFGLTDAINVYGKLGASDIGTIKQNFEDGSTTDTTSNHGFLWGVGISGSKDVYKGLRLGIDLQYGGWQTTADGATESGEKASNVSGQIRNQEYQATAFATKKFSFGSTGIDCFPYLGCRLSYLSTKSIKSIKYTTSSGMYENSFDEKNKNYVGLILGTDVFLRDQRMQLNIEGRFIDETALTAGLSYKY